MRTAEICPTCATFQNAECIIYNGPYLSNIIVNPLDSLQTILIAINNNLIPLTGITATPPAGVPATFVGQLYLSPNSPLVYYASTSGTADDFEVLITAPKTGVPQFSNNAAAVFAGLIPGQIYRTADFLKIVY